MRIRRRGRDGLATRGQDARETRGRDARVTSNARVTLQAFALPGKIRGEIENAAPRCLRNGVFVQKLTPRRFELLSAA